MKKCPKCGELLMDTTKVCPVCGYEFPIEDIKEVAELDNEGINIPLKNGGSFVFIEELFADMYPPFLEEELPALKLVFKNVSQGDIILKISAGIEKYVYEDKKTVKLKSGDTYSYSYYPKFRKEYMGELKSYGKSALYYKIEGDLKQVIEKKESIMILSYGDILWAIDGISLAKYIVRWVTPRDEIIRGELLNRVMDEMEKFKEFKEKGVKGMIFGDQNGALGIYLQTWALYNALKRWGVRYKDTPVSILTGYQRVRLPKEVLKEKGGNCIDLTVTFASALEAMGLIPIIF